jgi:2-(1,2-epoxy-1,2-dihydrophenyl)acetyl-CoA isomerase
METVRLERHGRGVVRVVMAYEDKGNALNDEFRHHLLKAFESLLQDPSCRVVVLASALKNFSVGGDLSSMDGLSDPKAGRARITSAHRFVRLMLAAEKPLIAEVRGHAVGAGAALALLCDTVVMAESATMGFPFATVGLAPDFAVAYLLTQRMGAARARQALLYARSYAGPQALTSGIADEVVQDDQLETTAMTRAQQLAQFPSQVSALTKRMVGLADDVNAVLDFETVAQPLCFASGDFSEGVAAFKEKRKPLFDPNIT